MNDLYEQRETTHRIIECAMEVHRALGPGLLESTYCACLEREFNLQGLPVTREEAIGLEYKGLRIDAAYRADFIVDRAIIVEVKSIERLERVHEAQVLTYLKLRKLHLGLLLNFNVPTLREGIRRLIK